MSEEKTSLDVLGIKPIADATNTAVTKTFDGVEGFLKRVCAPALEEFGLVLKDHVREWRLNNIVRTLEKARGKLEFVDERLQLKANPRVGIAIVENSSLMDNEEVQELWAGLLVASCTKDGQDDENLIFVNLLKQLTVVEVRILKYSCENARKILYSNGLIMAGELEVSCLELFELSGNQEIHRLDRELDHLRSLELLYQSRFGEGGGFVAGDVSLKASIAPTALALYLYVKSQGFNGDPVHYWKEGMITEEQFAKEVEEKQAAEHQAMMQGSAERNQALAKNIQAAKTDSSEAGSDESFTSV